MWQPASVSSLRRLSLLSDWTGEADARTPSPMSAGVRFKAECPPKSPIPRLKALGDPLPSVRKPPPQSSLAIHPGPLLPSRCVRASSGREQVLDRNQVLGCLHGRLGCSRCPRFVLLLLGCRCRLLPGGWLFLPVAPLRPGCTQRGAGPSLQPPTAGKAGGQVGGPLGRAVWAAHRKTPGGAIYVTAGGHR